MQTLSRAARNNNFITRMTSSLLIALMMTCAAFTVLSFVERLLPEWQPVYLPLVCFFLTVERLYTHRRFSGLLILSGEWAQLFFSEWALILIILKLVTSLSNGVGAFFWEASHWFSAFSHYFLTNEFMFMAIMALFTWLISGAFASLLDELDLTRSMQLELDPGQERGLPPLRERLLNLVFSLGSGLVVITALVRLDLRAFFAHTTTLNFIDMSALSGGGASTLLYFIFSIALLSQTRFIDLHTRWSVQKIPVSHNLGRAWIVYSLCFLGLLAALVALLPTSYSLETFGLIGSVLNWIARAFFMIAQALLTLLVLLISVPFMLLGKNPQDLKIKAPPPQIPEAAIGSQVAAQPGWWEAMRVTFLWIILFAIVLYALIQNLRQHSEILTELRRFTVMRALSRFWNWLQNQTRKLQKTIARTVQAGRDRLRRARPDSLRAADGMFFNLRNLDARQRVIFYYLALVRRGGEKGLPRRISQTPYEYASEIEPQVPEGVEDIEALTQAFIEARYSSRTVQTEKAGETKNAWDRLRKLIRAKK